VRGSTRLAFVRDKGNVQLGSARPSLRSRGLGRHALDGCEVMWREATGKIVFSRRLERAFPRQKLVAALKFFIPTNWGLAKGLLRLFVFLLVNSKSEFLLKL